jgi:hypothetical protein
MENYNSSSDDDAQKIIPTQKYSEIQNDIRIDFMYNNFWEMLKNWADKYTPISSFKNWESKLKTRLHLFAVGRDLILMVDSEEMIDSSTTVLDYLKMCLKYFKPFPNLKIKIEKKLLAWRANRSGVMKSILDLPLSKCDSHRVKRIVDTKNQQEDDLGVDLSHLAPETRRVCLQALAYKKRPFHNNAFPKNHNTNFNNKKSNNFNKKKPNNFNNKRPHKFNNSSNPRFIKREYN